MTLFDELAIDALCGEMGRFTPGMLLDRKRHAFDWGVPVPRSEPKSRNVHVAQVATKPKPLTGAEAYRMYLAMLDYHRNSPATARVAT